MAYVKVNVVPDRRPIGANPRTYLGFKSMDQLRKHIKEYQPSLYPLIGKIKRLKYAKGVTKDTKGSTRHLVYFKVRKK